MQHSGAREKQSRYFKDAVRQDSPQSHLDGGITRQRDQCQDHADHSSVDDIQQRTQNAKRTQPQQKDQADGAQVVAPDHRKRKTADRGLHADRQQAGETFHDSTPR